LDPRKWATIAFLVPMFGFFDDTFERDDSDDAETREEC
jgi:hypothetical protein